MNIEPVWQALQNPAWVAVGLTAIGVIAAGINFALIKPVRNRQAREQAEKEVVRNLLLFLDNRRLLQGGHWGTSITDINNSVHQIRSRLGEDIERLDEDSEAARPIREMQAACRECLSQIESLPQVPEGEEVWRDLGVHRRWSAALLELRATCLPRIKQLSEGYGVDLTRSGGSS